MHSQGAPSLGLERDQPTVLAGETRHADQQQGLSAEEVAERTADGRTNRVARTTSRPVLEIVRANVLTFFNALLLTLFLLTLATGHWQNALFGLVILTNASIGIVQELRAKRTLDRLAVLNAPTARVVRDGQVLDVDAAEVVIDELMRVRTGDQVTADGVVTASTGLEVDEALLTGESHPVAKECGDQLRSGSVVVGGHASCRATAVGPAAYANQLAAEARRYTVTRSELVAGTNRILRWISLVLLLVGPVLLWSQFRSDDNENWREAVTGTVAGLVGMVPEGLVLLTSLAFMVATMTLARRQVLVQELPAVEGLARVDVVCLDKTGTLTYGDMTVEGLETTGDCTESDAGQALALLAAEDGGNATAAALAVRFPAPEWTRSGGVAFDSVRKWSSVVVQGRGSWVLGAPEMVLPVPQGDLQHRVRGRADELAATGGRVLLLARTDGHGEATAGGGIPALPPRLAPVALVLLSERVREDASATLAFFTSQGVALKVLSGDNPRTVGAVAGKVGIPTAAEAVDARTLPQDQDALADVLETSSVFGRVSPSQKQAMIAALQSRGHVVAMTGDGVNDTLALKDADIGIAMGNGAPAARAVAQIVLLDGQFAHLPAVVAEGRRVIANIERASTLFLVKNTYALVLALVSAATLSAYPLAPIQLTLLSTLTIGVPGFLLAMLPNARRYVPGFLSRVLWFSLPIGVLTGAFAFCGYRAIRLLDPQAGVEHARTTATIVILVVSLWTVVVSARPMTRQKLTLCVSLGVAAVAAVAVPPIGRDIFLFSTTGLDVALGLGFGVVGAIGVEMISRALALRRPGHAAR